MEEKFALCAISGTIFDFFRDDPSNTQKHKTTWCHFFLTTKAWFWRYFWHIPADDRTVKMPHYTWRAKCRYEHFRNLCGINACTHSQLARNSQCNLHCTGRRTDVDHIGKYSALQTRWSFVPTRDISTSYLSGKLAEILQVANADSYIYETRCLPKCFLKIELETILEKALLICWFLAFSTRVSL